MNGKVAILIPVYNGERYLAEALDSALAQTAGNVEIYCADDGSTDGTSEILRKYAETNAAVHMQRWENHGVAQTLNLLLDSMSDDIVAFTILDADDYIHPGAVERLSAVMEASSADVVECGIASVPHDARCPMGLTLSDSITYERKDMSSYWLKRTRSGCWINKQNKLYRRSAVGNVRFRAGLAYEEDYLYECEVNSLPISKVVIPDLLYAYRDNPGSATKFHGLSKYVHSCLTRIRLTFEVFVVPNRVPEQFRDEYLSDVSSDIIRMLIRKNLRRNEDGKECRMLFAEIGKELCRFEKEYGFQPKWKHPIHALLYNACRKGHYLLGKCLAYMI